MQSSMPDATTAAVSDEYVAKWMFAQIMKTGRLRQKWVVVDIRDRFGASFVYKNSNGHLAISKSVLSAFKALRGDKVEWNRKKRCWDLV